MDIKTAIRSVLGGVLGVLSLIIFGITAGYTLCGMIAGVPEQSLMTATLPWLITAALAMVISFGLQRIWFR